MSLNVLNVLPVVSTRSGGPVVFVASAAEALRIRGHTVRTIATDLARAPGARPQHVVTREEILPSIRTSELSVYPTRFPRRLLHSPALARAARIGAASADVIHVHSVWLHPQFAASRAAKRAGVPYIVSPHGALDPALGRRGRGRKALTTWTWQGRMLERAALIHVTTPAEAELISDVAPDVPRATVPVPVDLREFADLPDRAVFRRRFLDGYDGQVILFLGRISFKKSIDTLIAAFSQIQRDIDCRLVIAGPDDSGLTPSLEKAARRAGVREMTHFVGPLFGEARREALASADAWALPSRTENFGVAVIEAMAAGCPVVISDAVNLAAAVSAADAGVITNQLAESVAAGLRLVLTDSGRRERMCAAARTLALTYDIPAVVDELEQMYLRAAG